jgi:hypothetical protein
MRKIVVSFPEHVPNGNCEQGERREEEETPSVIPACNEQRPSQVRSKMQVERQEIQMQESWGLRHPNDAQTWRCQSLRGQVVESTWQRPEWAN